MLQELRASSRHHQVGDITAGSRGIPADPGTFWIDGALLGQRCESTAGIAALQKAVSARRATVTLQVRSDRSDLES